MQYDVVIIGGGASGCAAAWFLSKEGLKIALLDKQSPCPDKICTTAINPRSVSFLKRFDVLESLKINQYVKIRGLQTFAYDNSSFQGFYSHETSYPDHGYCIPRYQLDLVLRQNILNKANIDYFESIQVENIEKHSTTEEVIIYGRQQDQIKKFQTKIVIDAMGRNSVVGKQHQLFHFDETHKRYAILAQFSGLRSLDSMFTIGTNEEIGPGYYTIFPIQSDGLAMVALIIPEKNWLNLRGNLEESLLHFLKREGWPLRHWFTDAKQESKVLSFGPIAFHSTTFVMPQLFMIGDSTGFYDPLTGEGLTQAFMTGEWAAEASMNFFNGQSFTSVSEWYSSKVRQYKDEVLQHSRQLQDLLKFPNAFNRFIYSLSRNQEAADWLACAVGNIFQPGERISGRLKELLFSPKVLL
jgi:flavin-dependent dehydrogenase